MKEPLLWFVLIGILLFAVDRSRAPDAIIVNTAVKSQIATLWETQTGTKPGDEALDSLVHDWVREEVFYREALRLGLDREDTIVRKRLVQKLGFLARSVDEDSITAEDIQAYYKVNIADYTLPVRYSLSQVYFKNAAQYDALMQLLNAGDNWMEVGDGTMLPLRLVKKTEREIKSTLGIEFAAQLAGLRQGVWVGPVTSSFGFHIVRLDELTPQTQRPLALIENQLIAELLQQRREQSLDDYYQELMDQYEVVYE
ncbi:peptidyl-prolyl cis-trans isomerase [Halieaceae bacterium IMCC14734]|uniref:peptidylprolyl isomerase n=1 Tax=Candidatus Litorirhabdus singularis TaxID=2518993 RepID=A0ABT3TKX3_9GAMM|nr:peptidylprolyl isomerase [Candidatus Litorirhabdus singularis]MCX2982926.1 peptidyl-prolyl cis-trans isomerase [Candidatus Litorirhabdus singularis]